MAITTNHKKVWDFLCQYIPNPYGAAGLIGNLFAESSLDPRSVTGGGLKSKADKEAYIENVKNGKITPYDFIHDGIAFGLAQWCYWSRKEQLFLYCRERHYDLDDIYAQLNYLAKELLTYTTVWKTLLNAKTVREASDIVMEKYEKPANMSEQAKLKRAFFGAECYEAFVLDEIPTDLKTYILTTADKVNLRSGNGKNFGIITQAKAAGTKYEWVATADNGWHAIIASVNHKNQVVWISPDYSRKESG